MTDFGTKVYSEDHPLYKRPVETDNKVYEKTSVDFTAADPETKTLELSPPSGVVWHLTKIRAWTDEAPPDNTNAGAKTDIDIFINGTSEQIAKEYSTEKIGATYRTCGIAIDSITLFGQRLRITETTNGVYITATKTGSGTHALYLQVEGTEE